MSCRKSNFMYYLLFYLTLILMFYYIEQGLYQYCTWLLLDILETLSSEHECATWTGYIEEMFALRPWDCPPLHSRALLFSPTFPRPFPRQVVNSPNPLQNRARCTFLPFFPFTYFAMRKVEAFHCIPIHLRRQECLFSLTLMHFHVVPGRSLSTASSLLTFPFPILVEANCIIPKRGKSTLSEIAEGMEHISVQPVGSFVSLKAAAARKKVFVSAGEEGDCSGLTDIFSLCFPAGRGRSGRDRYKRNTRSPHPPLAGGTHN